MKRLLTIILALALICGLTACGSEETPAGNTGTAPRATSGADTSANDPAQAEDAPGTSAEADEADMVIPDVEGEAMNAFIKWMVDGKFSFDFTMTMEAEGLTLNAAGTMAADGDKSAVTLKMEMMGMQITQKQVTKDGKLYAIDDSARTITVFSVDEADSTVQTDFSGMELIGTGTGEIGDKNLPYEDYASGGGTIRMFLDGGEVYAMVMGEGIAAVTMFLSNQSNNVPAGIFDIPSDYTEIEAGDMFGDFGMEDFETGEYDTGDFNIDDILSEYGLEGLEF